MKEIILDPLILMPILSCFVVYFILIFYWSESSLFRKSAAYFFTFLFIITLCDFEIYPVSLLQPSQLLNQNLGPIQLVINIGYYSASILLLRFWFKHLLHSSLLLFNNFFLGIFIILSLLSILWSDTPIYALKYELVVLQVTLIGTQVCQKYSWTEIVSILRWSTTAISILSAFYALTQPSIGVIDKGWKGVMGHPNRLGVVLALNITLWLFHGIYYPKQRWIAVFFALFSLYVRQNTNSTTSFILIVLLLTLLGCLRVLKTLPYKAAFAGVLMFMLIGTCIGFVVVENWNDLLISLDKDPTLTGRTIVWPQMIEKGFQRPFLGYGSHSFWQDWRGEDNPAYGIVSDNGWVPPHAHNGFLELFLEFGLVGLILFLFAFVITLSICIKYMISSSSPESLVPPLILTWMLIPNITVSSLFQPKLIWFIYILINCRISYELSKGSQSFNQAPKKSIMLN